MRAYLKLVMRHKWISAYLPIIIGFCILSFSSSYYCDLYAGDFDTIHLYIIPNFHMLVSMMSVWWTILFYSGFVSEQGNELLFLRFKPNRLMGCQIFLEVLYVILVFFYFFFVRDTYQLPVSFFYLLAAESFLMNGVAFLLIHLTRSISLSLGSVALYCVFLLKFDQMDMFGIISIFPNPQDILETPVHWLLIDMAAAMACHVMGRICFQYRKVYF
ncbi:MAG: hypothetical protein HFG38_11945 [Eubacterium sp.]|jgi:hypothetical protein|nr:hypothetical protein [Eubacterium sp.]